MSMKIEEVDSNVHLFTHDVKSGFEKWYFLSSDHHWDNPHCDRKLLKKHLNRAKERNAGVFVFGDLFCAMQGKYDRRHQKSDIRPEHNVSNYLDALVSTSIDWYSPYVENLCLVTEGNHETSISDHCETNLLDRFTSGINILNRPDTPVFKGSYDGWVIFSFKSGQGRSESVRLKYFHGSGGGGLVTKGVNKAVGRASYLPDANIVCFGHIHQLWKFPVERERLSITHRQSLDVQYHLCCGGYKEEYLGGKGNGYHIKNGRPPKPLGGWWLRFYYKNKKIHYEFMEAR